MSKSEVVNYELMTHDQPYNVAMQCSWLVLTYHLVDPDLQDRNSVTPMQFAAHINGLVEEGHTFCAIDDVYAMLSSGNCSESGVLLAFDDAYQPTLEYAAPILSERRIPWMLFVPVNHVGKTNLWDSKAKFIRPHLSWQALRSLDREFVTLGSHGCSHHSLVKFGPDQVEYELVRSKTVLEDRLGIPVNYVAYPFGDFNSLVEKIACRHYRLGFSTWQGDKVWNHRPWAIYRMLVTSSHDVNSLILAANEFRAQLETYLLDDQDGLMFDDVLEKSAPTLNSWNCPK